MLRAVMIMMALGAAVGTEHSCKARGGKESVGVATYVTDEGHTGFVNLQRSLEAHGWGQATNVGAGAEWEAGDEGRWVRRAQAYLRYVEQQDAERVVVLVDGHDVLFQGGPDEAVAGLARSGKEVLVAGERLCETEGCLAGQEQQEARAPQGATMRFANAGMVVGRAGRVAAFLRDMVRAMERGMVDDQAGVVKVLGAGKHAAGVDYRSEVFGVVSPAAEHFDHDWAVERGVLTRRGGGRPVAVHFAGMQYGGALTTPCQHFLATKYNDMASMLAHPSTGRRVVAVVMGSQQRAVLDGLLAQTRKPDAVYVDDASIASEYTIAHHVSGPSAVLEKEKEAATLVVTLGTQEGEIEGTLVEQLCEVRFERLRVPKAVMGGVAPWWRPTMTVSPCNLAGFSDNFLNVRRQQRSYAALADESAKRCKFNSVILPEKSTAYGTNCTSGKEVWPGKSCAVRKFGMACTTVKCTDGSWTTSECFDMKEAVKTVRTIVKGLNSLPVGEKQAFIVAFLKLVSEKVKAVGVDPLHATISIVKICPIGDNGLPDATRCMTVEEIKAMGTERVLQILAEEQTEIFTAVAQEDPAVKPETLAKSLEELKEGTKIGSVELTKAGEVVENLVTPCMYDELAKFVGSGTASGENCTAGGKVNEGAECGVTKVGQYCVPAKCAGNNRWVTECRPVEQAVHSYAFLTNAPFATLSEAERKELEAAVETHLLGSIKVWAGETQGVTIRVTELCPLGVNNQPVEAECISSTTGAQRRGRTLEVGGTYGKLQVVQEAGKHLSPGLVSGAIRDAMKSNVQLGKYKFVSDASEVVIAPQGCSLSTLPLPAGAVVDTGCDAKNGSSCAVTKAGHFCIAAQCAAVGSVWTAPLCYPLADAVKAFEMTINAKFSQISDKAAFVTTVKGHVEKILNNVAFTTTVKSVCPLDAQGAVVQAECWDEATLKLAGSGRVAKALAADDTHVVFQVVQSAKAPTTPPSEVVSKVVDGLSAGKKFDSTSNVVSIGEYSTMCPVSSLKLEGGQTNCTDKVTMGTECRVTKDLFFCTPAKCMGLVWDQPVCSSVTDSVHYYSLTVATPYSSFDSTKRDEFEKTIVETVKNLLVKAGGKLASFDVSLAQVCAVKGDVISTTLCWGSDKAASVADENAASFVVIKVVQDTSSPSLSSEAVQSTLTGLFPKTLPTFGAVSDVSRAAAPTPAPGTPRVVLKPEDDDDLEAGEIAAIVICVILGVGIIAGGIYVVMRKKQMQAKNDPVEYNDPTSDVPNDADADADVPPSKTEV